MSSTTSFLRTGNLHHVCTDGRLNFLLRAYILIAGVDFDAPSYKMR